MSEAYLGQMMQFGGNFAIRNWALCSGQLLGISQNTALFSILGTTYGGNGVTTFALPDCRGRFSLHWGQGPGLPNYTLGEQGGNPTITLLSSNMPTLPVIIPCSSNQATGANPVSNIPAAAVNPNDGGSIDGYSAPATANGSLSGAYIQGGNQPIATLPPYLCVTWLICLAGIFPSRN